MKDINTGSLIRIVVKALILFAVLNLIFAALNPIPWIAKAGLYNTLIPGRLRLPYGENPPESYNITLSRLEGMFAAHEISDGEKPSDEFRILLLGDSAAWGWLLEPDQTLSACINRQNLKTSDGKTIRLYNLGYPVLDATKDLLILDYGMAYQPDMVVWMVTLAALYPDEQLFHEIVKAHPDEVRELITRYDLALDSEELPESPDFLDRSIIGQRRELASWLKHQMYGVAWAVTGIDHRNPNFFKPVQQNLHGGTSMLDGTQVNIWQRDDLSLQALAAGLEMAENAGVEMLFINEPIYISAGENSDLRYNFYYPRPAYDGYRELMNVIVTEKDWQYVDLWDAMSADLFTDSSLHLTPSATCEFAEILGAQIQAYAQ